MNKCDWCENITKNKEHYTAMSPLIEKYEVLIREWDKMYGQFWYNSKEIDEKILNKVLSYDQATNTVGRGLICDDCHEKDEMIYQKYRLVNKKGGDPYGMLKIVVDDNDNEYGLDEMDTWYQETKERVSKVSRDK